MFRKNTIERSNSAGTRVLASRKLPSDFFTPSKSSIKKYEPMSAAPKPREVKSIEGARPRDNMLFTFNQSDMIKKASYCSETPKLKRVGSNKAIKLPPILLRIHRESMQLHSGELKLNRVGRHQNQERI